MSNDHLGFRAVSHFNEPLIIVELEQNLKSWLDWSLLGIGAWENVTTGTSGVYGGSFSQLHAVNDHSYTGNTVFESVRKDWIWETGINYSSPTGGTFNPLSVQIYVSGTAINTGTVGHTHYINYPLGRVVFDAAHTTGSVKAQYSFRSVQVYLADDINWWFEVQYNSYNPAETQWAQNLTSGDYSLSSSNRVQLPAIIIESMGKKSAEPFELGTLSAKNKHDVLFHVISQDRYTRNNIADILSLQEGKSIILYDTDKVYTANQFPLDHRGMKVANPIMYPDIVGNSSLQLKQAIFDRIRVSEVKTNHPNLHWSIIRASLEVIY